MNILIITDTYKPAINGVVEVVKNLKKRLEFLGHKVFIIAPKYKGVPEEEGVLRFKSVPFPGLSEHRISWLYSRQIKKKFFIDNKIDIIHSQATGTLGMLAIVLAKRYKIPHINHYQTFFEDYAHYLHLPKKIGQFSIKTFTRWFCNRVDLITVPSLPFFTVLENYKIKRPIKLWVSGINIKKFELGINHRKEWGIPEGAFVLSYVGRIAKEKNIPFLLELMPYIVKKDPNIYFLMAGDGPMRKDLEKYATIMGIEKNVRFLGYIESEQIANVYASSDLFVFSSLTETQGLVVLEAMAAGLPVVAVNAYGLKDTLKNDVGAYLVNLNRMEFLEKIFALKDNPELYAEKKAQALEYVKDFSYEASTEKMVEIYLSVIQEYKSKKSKN